MDSQAPWLGKIVVKSAKIPERYIEGWAAMSSGIERDRFFETVSQTAVKYHLELIWADEVQLANEHQSIPSEDQNQIRRLCRSVNQKQTAAVGLFPDDIQKDINLSISNNHKFINLEEIENILPLSAHTALTVPVELQDAIFGQPCATEAESRQYNQVAPDLKTYAIIDANLVPNWDGVRDDIDTPLAQLLIGSQAADNGQGPWLVKLQEQDRFSTRLFSWFDSFHFDSPVHHWRRSCMVLIRSREPFETLYNHLRKFTKIRTPQNRWFFFNFWNAKFGYYFFRELAEEFEIAAKVYGMTSTRHSSLIYSVLVPDADQDSMSVFTWDNLIPKSSFTEIDNSTLIYDGALKDVVIKAHEKTKQHKVIRYLANTFKNPKTKRDCQASDLAEFVLHFKTEGHAFGIHSDLSLSRLANIAARLGIGFMQDPRYQSWGLSPSAIQFDSRAERIFTIGSGCSNEIEKARTKFDFAKVVLYADSDTYRTPAPNDIAKSIEAIDPAATWVWGESAIREFAELFHHQFTDTPQTTQQCHAHLSLAYFLGLDFRTDPSWPFRHRLDNIEPENYAKTILEIANEQFT